MLEKKTLFIKKLAEIKDIMLDYSEYWKQIIP